MRASTTAVICALLSGCAPMIAIPCVIASCIAGQELDGCFHNSKGEPFCRPTGSQHYVSETIIDQGQGRHSTYVTLPKKTPAELRLKAIGNANDFCLKKGMGLRELETLIPEEDSQRRGIAHIMFECV